MTSNRSLDRRKPERRALCRELGILPATIRPKLMTVLTMMIGLVHILWNDGTRADVMKRIAAPMVEGLVASFVLKLLVYPAAVFAIWKGR